MSPAASIWRTAAAPNDTRRILVVDDDNDTRQLQRLDVLAGPVDVIRYGGAPAERFRTQLDLPSRQQNAQNDRLE